MPRRCAIGCTPTRHILHVFPNPNKFPEQFKAWVRVVSGKDECDFDYKNMRVCDRHFTERDRNRNNRLNALAVPSLFLRGNLGDVPMLNQPHTSSSIVPAQFLQLDKILDKQKTSGATSGAFESPLLEHNYCKQVKVHLKSDHVDMDTENQPCGASTSKFFEPTLRPELLVEPEVTSGESLGAHNETLLEHNYCKTSRRYGKNRKIRQPIVVSSKCKAYQQHIKNLRRQIYRLRNRGKDLKSRLENAENLFNKSSFQKVINNMSPAAKAFCSMQYYQTHKKPTGRRFNFEEKVLSLSLFKRSPKCYNLMSKLFTLPSGKSLKRLLGEIKLDAGINSIIFQKLKQSVADFDIKDKLCTLIFDEMSIMPQIHYDSSKDELKGFANHGINQIANHALVFMVKGIRKPFKQPVAYYFTNALTKIELKSLIEEVIKNIQRSGLIILATVCDQSTVNVGAIEELVKQTKANYLRRGQNFTDSSFEINGKKIIPLYDVPHLLKGLRNNLLTKNMTYVDYEDENKVKLIKWEYFEQLYAADKSFGELRCLQKLTEEHIVPEKIKKMKVKTAAQVFSHSVAVATEHLTARGNLPRECRNIIPFTLLVDNLFDSMNCNSFNVPNGKIFKGPVRRNSPHHQLWQKAVKYFKSVRFLKYKKVGNKVQISEMTVPSVSNFVKTVEGIQVLWKILSQKYCFDSMFTRNFNQDPIENFFGSIRNCGARNVSPNAVSFEGAFKTILLNNMSAPHSLNANCERDHDNYLHTLDFFVQQSTQSNDVDEEMVEKIYVNEGNEINIRTDFLNNDGDSDSGQRDYVCGWVLRKCLIHVIKKCKTCRKDVIDSDNVDENSYIRAKEYFSTKKLLCYPSRDTLECFLDIQNICVSHLKKDVPRKGLKKSIKMHADIFVKYPFKCETHSDALKEHFTTLTANVIIYSWCRSINRILAGKLTYIENDDETKVYAQKYYNKHRHNKINK